MVLLCMPVLVEHLYRESAHVGQRSEKRFLIIIDYFNIEEIVVRTRVHHLEDCSFENINQTI